MNLLMEILQTRVSSLPSQYLQCLSVHYNKLDRVMSHPYPLLHLVVSLFLHKLPSICYYYRVLESPIFILLVRFTLTKPMSFLNNLSCFSTRFMTKKFWTTNISSFFVRMNIYNYVFIIYFIMVYLSLLSNFLIMLHCLTPNKYYISTKL